MKKVPQKSLTQKSLVITDQALMLELYGRDCCTATGGERPPTTANAARESPKHLPNPGSWLSVQR